MSRSLGEWLRDLRKQRRISLNRLAQQAAVAKSTLIRWESETHRPRLFELDAVLDALDAAPEQRKQAYAFLDAPRAKQRLDQRAEFVPTVGEMLRAMRHRRGLSLDQVAVSLGVHSSTVSRWEGGKVTLASDLREPLLTLLGARPQEREALGENQWMFGQPAEAEVSLEELNHRLKRIFAQAQQGEHALLDLEFILFRSHLWPMLGRREEAQNLLAMGCFVYSLALSWVDRCSESARYAEQALELLETIPAPVEARINVVTVAALTTAKGGSAKAPARAVEQLRSVLPLATDPQMATGVYRDLADYAHRYGQTEAALRYIHQAYEAAERAGDPAAVRLARYIHAETLLKAGKPQAALPLLSVDLSFSPLQSILEALQWGEILLALGEAADAQPWLERAGSLLRTYEYPQLHEPYARLARQL